MNIYTQHIDLLMAFHSSRKDPTYYHVSQLVSKQGPNSTHCAMHFDQGSSMDFTLSGVMSKNTKQQEDCVDINGEKCWILVTDHFTGI